MSPATGGWAGLDADYSQWQRHEPSTELHWHPSAVAAPVAVAGVLLVVGVLTGRVELAGLALPLLLTVAWGWSRRPRGFGSVTLAARLSSSAGEPGRLAGDITWTPAPGVEGLQVRVSGPGHRPARALLAVPEPAAPGDDPATRVVPVSIGSVRTGRRAVFLLDRVEVAPQHVVEHTVVRRGPVELTVLPRARSLREVPLPVRLQGLTGPHGSRRLGEGGDLHDVNLFGPGDRLRRIDWRVTTRRAAQTARDGTIAELYVRRTFATADAAVMLVLDSRDDVGPDIGTWDDASRVRESEPTSLDHARNAALTFARRYLDAGDRVGLEDLGRLHRPVAPAGGRRQLQRLTERIARAEPEGEPKPRRRVPRLPSGALIMVFSTFLDDDAARFATVWRTAGHRVVAVDVLPVLRTARVSEQLEVAHRIIAMERADRLGDLVAAGVELVAWADDPRDPTALPVSAATALLARRRVRR